MTKQIFINAKLILENKIIDKCLVIENGQMNDLQGGRSALASEFDCEGAHIAAGLIEIHIDNIDMQIKPRTEVHWAMDQAVLPHDAELTSCGITTVFDAIRIGSIHRKQNPQKTTAR